MGHRLRYTGGSEAGGKESERNSDAEGTNTSSDIQDSTRDSLNESSNTAGVLLCDGVDVWEGVRERDCPGLRADGVGGGVAACERVGVDEPEGGRRERLGDLTVALIVEVVVAEPELLRVTLGEDVADCDGVPC